MSLVESAALAALKSAEKEGSKEMLEAVLQPLQVFLQQVYVQRGFNPAMEYRRLEFLSACSPFYKLWSEEVLRDALARVLAPIRLEPSLRDARAKGIKLEQRALDTLVSISKSGVLKAAHLEALNAECLDLAAKAGQSFPIYNV